MKNNTVHVGIKTLLFPFFVFAVIIGGIILGINLKDMSAPIATYGIPLGLFFMIYPAMTKIEFKEFASSFKDVKKVSLMLVLNYVLDPFLVAGISYLTFIFFEHLGLISSSVASQTIVGLILLGVAPCIAMVIVWTDLSKGNLPLAVSFVAWNAGVQIITTPLFVYFLTGSTVHIDILLILESVLLYLALPLVAGVTTRQLLKKKSYFTSVLNTLGNVQTIALLFTILIIFWSQGYGIVEYPSLIWMVGIVLLLFYFVLFHTGYLISRKIFKYTYEDSTSIGYTVAARDFEISIAIALVAFSQYPIVSIVTAIGPLLEIPLMLLLVLVQLRRRKVILQGEYKKEISGKFS